MGRPCFHLVERFNFGFFQDFLSCLSNGEYCLQKCFQLVFKDPIRWGVNMDKAEVEGKKRGTGRMSKRQMDVEERRLDQDRGMGRRGMECVDGKGK